MEIWQPTNTKLAESLEEEIQVCRKQVFRSLYGRKKLLIAQEKNISEEILSADDLSSAFDHAFEDYLSYLKHFSRASEITKSSFKTEIRMPDSNDDIDNIPECVDI